MKNQIYKFSLFVLLASIIFLYQGCKDEGTPVNYGTLSGTATLPHPVPNKTIFVAVDDDLNGDNGFKYSFQGSCGTDITVDYTINNIEPGTYYVYAAVFVQGDMSQGPQDGDFLGIYGGTLDNPPTAPNVTITSQENKNCCFELAVMGEGTIAPGKWIGTAQFGGLDFWVNDEGTYITKVEYKFSNWYCAGVTHNGTITSTSNPGYSITDRHISFQVNLDPSPTSSPKYLKIEGDFSTDGKSASGTFSRGTCSGTWQASPSEG